MSQLSRRGFLRNILGVTACLSLPPALILPGTADDRWPNYHSPPRVLDEDALLEELRQSFITFEKRIRVNLIGESYE